MYLPPNDGHDFTSLAAQTLQRPLTIACIPEFFLARSKIIDRHGEMSNRLWKQYAYVAAMPVWILLTTLLTSRPNYSKTRWTRRVKFEYNVHHLHFKNPISNSSKHPLSKLNVHGKFKHCQTYNKRKIAVRRVTAFKPILSRITSYATGDNQISNA